MRSLPVLVVVGSLAACGPSTQIVSIDGESQDDGAAHLDAPRPLWDAPPPPIIAKVYAHSASDLYDVNPDTLAVTHVAAFSWPSGSDQMTDIALDKDGNMYGISYDYVYRVNKETGATEQLGHLDRRFNGLSFVPADQVDPNGPEILVASALDGGWLYQLNPETGASTPIGQYGNGYVSSGDVVAVSNATYATVQSFSASSDLLVRVNVMTGAATEVGETGYSDIWGLGYWKNKVFGFTKGNEFVTINVTTGRATPVETSTVEWWGAGVTTSAPVVQ